MGDLLALAGRCEAATGPDRRLDIEIDLACCVKFAELLDGETIDDHVSMLLEEETGDDGRERSSADQWGIARYTASLDAAMSLVPDDIFARLDFTMPQAIMVRWDGGYAEVARASALEMPLALCAAALKARAAQEGIGL